LAAATVVGFPAAAWTTSTSLSSTTVAAAGHGITFSLFLKPLTCLFFSAAGDEDLLLRVATFSLACLRISRACSLAARSLSFFFFLPPAAAAAADEVGELGMDMYCAARSRTLSLSACSDRRGPSHDARADVDPRGVSGRDRASTTLQLRLRSGSRRFMDSGMTRFFFSPLAGAALAGGAGLRGTVFSLSKEEDGLVVLCPGDGEGW
jgi:hypothetical protein